MMKITSADYAAISRALQAIYTIQDLDGFVVTAMRELPAIIQADVSGYNEVNYSGRRLTTVLDSPRTQKLYHDRQLRFEPMMHQNPLIEYYSRVSDGPKKISDFLSQRQWRESRIYREYYNQAQGEHQIAVVLPIPDSTMVAFAFNRTARDFTERDRAVLTELQPHLTQAYLNARTYTNTLGQLHRRERMLDAISAGWIDVGADLEIVDATSLAYSNLESFFPVAENGQESLPREVKAWVIANMGQALGGNPVAPLVVKSPVGRLILRLIVSEKTGECSILTERFLDTLSPETLLQLGLTNRQAEVLYWVSQGKSNAEVAIVLKVSLRTVVHHVSQILATLGVSNRTEATNLAARHASVRR